MELLMALIRDVLGNAAILVGLVALVGLVIQKKSFVEVFTGTVKTIVGFLIFYIGAGAGVSALNNFQSLFFRRFQSSRRHAFGRSTNSHGNDQTWYSYLADYGFRVCC